MNIPERQTKKHQPFCVIYDDKKGGGSKNCSNSGRDDEPKSSEEIENLSKNNIDDLTAIDWEQFQSYARFLDTQTINMALFNEDYQAACSFYFQFLRKLQIKVYATRVQLENEKQIAEEFQKANEGRQLLDIHKINKMQRIKEKQLANYQNSLQKSRSLIRKDPIVFENNLKAIKEDQNGSESLYFQCQMRGCGKVFPKASTLAHHQMLKHNHPMCDLSKNKIFSIEIKDDSSARKRFKY